MKDELQRLAGAKPATPNKSRLSQEDFAKAFDEPGEQRDKSPRRYDSRPRNPSRDSVKDRTRSVGRSRPENVEVSGVHRRRSDPRQRLRGPPQDDDVPIRRDDPLKWKGDRRADRSWKQESSPDAEGRNDSFRGSSVRDEPIRIPRTTAASEFLYGRSVVEAALQSSQRKLYHLYLYCGENRVNTSQDAALEKLAERKSIKVTKVDKNGLRMMDKMSDARPHNGCVLEASPLPQLPLTALGQLSDDPAKPGFRLDLAYQSSEEAVINGTSDFVSYRLPSQRKPFVLLLDGILDPGNLGGILRTAAFLGVNAVAITKHNSAGLTPVALKASAGAAEALRLFSVGSTMDFLTRSKEAGWMVYAAVPSTSRSRGNSHITLDRVETYDPLADSPTILVLGSEGEGLTKKIRREADHEVSIPGASGTMGMVDSLNVSVAAGILCSAFLKKQRDLIDMGDTVSEQRNEPSLW
jgi:21S rRNA (GM2251-2'-O)-methyltransferase